MPEKLFFPRCCNTFTLLGIKTHSYRTENAFSLCLFARARFPAKKTPHPTDECARTTVSAFLPRVVAAVVCASFLDSFRCCCFIFALLLLLYKRRRRRRRFFQKSNTHGFLLHHNILMNAAYGEGYTSHSTVASIGTSDFARASGNGLYGSDGPLSGERGRGPRRRFPRHVRGGPGTTLVFASRTTREAILFRSLLSRLLVPLARTIGARTRHRRRFACFRRRLLTEEKQEKKYRRKTTTTGLRFYS